MTLAPVTHDLALKVEEELSSFVEYNDSITAASVVSSFKNVALDLQLTVAQLPTNLWQVFADFDGRPTATVFNVHEVIKRVRAA